MTTSTFELIRLFLPAWEYVLGVTDPVEAGSVDLAAVQETIYCLIHSSEQAAVSAALDIRDYDDGRFAVCAWIDEMLLNGPPAMGEFWRLHLLQKNYYHTANAGEEFYLRLDGIEPSRQAVREIFLICLLLGFAGIYFPDGDKTSVAAGRQDILQALIPAVGGRMPDSAGRKILLSKYQLISGKGRKLTLPAVLSVMALVAVLGMVYLYLTALFRAAMNAAGT